MNHAMRMVGLQLAAGLAACAGGGCLPSDTRPPPGRAELTLVGEDLSSSTVTADGWELSFHRALLSLGEVGAHGEGCDEYSENRYLRIYDLVRREPQRVTTIHALGQCGLEFHIVPANDETVRGPGVGEATQARFATPARDPFFRGPENFLGPGIALELAGFGARDREVVGFTWVFRRPAPYETCGAPLTFAEEEPKNVELKVSVSQLFRERAESQEAALRFEPYAAADRMGDGDGRVTFEELEAVPLRGEVYASLGERLYYGLFSELIHVPGLEVCMIKPMPRVE